MTISVTWKSTGSISPEVKRGKRKNSRNAKIAILVPTSVTTRLTSRLAVSLPTVGPPSPLHQDWRSIMTPVMNAFASIAPGLHPAERSDTYPRNASAAMSGSGIRPHGFRSRRLGTSQDLPVDEVPEGRVDPRLHLGFLPVLPEPSGPEGVLRPLQPARPIVVGQDAALSHVVGVGTEEHHVEGEGHLGAKVGDRRIVVEDPDELGLLHEDLADPMELLIEVVHHARLGIGIEGLDLAARKVHGDDDGQDNRDGLDEREELGETDIDHGVRTTSPPHQD